MKELGKDVPQAVESIEAAKKRGFKPIDLRMATIYNLIASKFEVLGAKPAVVKRLRTKAGEHGRLYRLASRAIRKKTG